MEKVCKRDQRTKSAKWDIATRLFFLLGGILLINVLFATTSQAQDLYTIDTTAWKWGVCRIFYLTQGPWGALQTTLAGILTVIAASTGNYKYAYAFLAVALGCFILQAMISLWFGGEFGCEDFVNGGDFTASLEISDVSQS